MDSTPVKQAAVPEGAEQVDDGSQQDAADGVGGGGTEAAHTETQREIERDVSSFDVQGFLTEGLTPTLDRISQGTTVQPGPDSAQRETTVAQLRESIELQTSVENIDSNTDTVATPEPQGEAQVSSSLPSYAPPQSEGGRALFRENELRVSEMQMRQRVERERYLGYTQPPPFTHQYPP